METYNILLCSDFFAKRVGRSRIPHECAIEGDLEKTNHLIAEGANVNAVTRYGIKPLFWAEIEEHKDIMELLIKQGGHK